MNGQVVRFGDKGWGFIRPDDGGRDVFMHVSEVPEFERDHIQAGVRVSYSIAEGDRGPRAVGVRIIALPAAVNGARGTEPDEPVCDLLTVAELRHELGRVVDDFVEIAKSHGWVE